MLFIKTHPHKGDVTHHHDQPITLHNFKIMNDVPKIVGRNPMPFSSIIFTINILAKVL